MLHKNNSNDSAVIKLNDAFLFLKKELIKVNAVCAFVLL